ncbi:O-acyltransferase like protein isoform X1 [Nasonia vitripennis]|uniref:Nose resistant-to-fluoxetine protein N-terminal domain-containing protein n=1 Tax=Nasonia vitripennis TaxID=7425 RepID=A0A7M7IPQ6_NASVI|nr:O-acyltransferase like protein isoform X1 [Nasonia vitripennis]
MRSLLCVSLLLLATIGRISCDSEASVRLQSIVPTIDSSEPAKDGDAAANPSRTPEERSSNWTTLTEALDIFSARNLARNWQEGKFPLNQECERDVSRYIEGLRRQELWALKVDDASGRYTNGFFWGNSYFVGSATECEFIGQAASSKSSSSSSSSSPESISEAEEFNAEPHKKRANVGHSGASSIVLPEGANDRPPYPLGFFMMRIAVNGTLAPATRLLHLGVCLPFSCHAADVAVIAKLAASDNAGKYSFVEKVRDQHDYYDMYADKVFWILFGVSTVVLFLLIGGTSYDVYLSKRIARKQNMSYDLEKHVKLEQLATGKIHNASQGRAYIPVPVAESGQVTASPPINNNNDHEGSLRPPTPDLQKLNVWEELLLSFSIRANFRVICEGEVGRDTISTIHGLRAISMAWVILGHTCIVVFKYSDNMEYRKIVEKRFLFQTIQNGAFSVDTFFFMGGLLVSFLYFRTNAKGDLNRLTQGTRGFVAGFLKFLGFLGYRFCRLTAPYMFVLGITEISMKWFHSNSVFEPPTADHENCQNYWWRNLLYINTLYPVDQMCMLWSWYVADDTQFYIVGAVILIVATNHFKIAAFSLVALMVSSWITTGYIALVNNHMPNTDDPLALFDKIYDKPWTRLGPYLIGMAVGYFLFKTDCKIKMSKATVFIGWLLSTACLLSLLYGLYETELSPATGAAYSSLSHSAWALSLAWIVVACSTGYGGYVNDILSAPILYPFSRVTYCAYLVHPIVIRLTAMNMDSPLHLGKDSMLITFFGQVVASYILSFVISVSFEAPVVSMLKILSPKKRNRIQ